MTKIERSFMTRFLEKETSGGLLLMGAAILAMILSNSPLANYYNLLIDTPVAIQVGAFEIAKPLLLWVNDGLMAIFFLLVGLELKREVLEGELSNKKAIILPALGAIGGMVIPAAIYIYLNFDNPIALNGWAIPAATDIAFALAILALLGSKVPTSLKIFLTSLAIFDDIGAIIIIAFFYTSQLSLSALIIALLCLIPLTILNRKGIAERSLYIVFGIIMWSALLKSGVHATLVGIILAGFIPIRSQKDPQHSPLKSMEHDLHSTVAYLILPIFAFCNSGINLSTLGVDDILHPMPLGIALGLFLGKQIGVFGFCWLGIKLKWTELPKGMNLLSLYGTAALCGIGFTMSLFIGSLAFEETGSLNLIDERLGIILGSLLSGLAGYFILRLDIKKAR